LNIGKFAISSIILPLAVAGDKLGPEGGPVVVELLLLFWLLLLLLLLLWLALFVLFVE
jgi:hypothetical protein